MASKAIQIFESHSKLDVDSCNKLDVIAAREGVKVFRSELEEIKAPAWETIKKAMQDSKALFLLVGPELVKAQEKGSKDWKFTQNWIAYEVGLACALGIDVWVSCDNVTINFPVPYLNNYVTGVIDTKAGSFDRKVFKSYASGGSFPLGYFPPKEFHCPHNGCGAKFNLHSFYPKATVRKCPTCLQDLEFPNGWLWKTE